MKFLFLILLLLSGCSNYKAIDAGSDFVPKNNMVYIGAEIEDYCYLGEIRKINCGIFARKNSIKLTLENNQGKEVTFKEIEFPELNCKQEINGKRLKFRESEAFEIPCKFFEGGLESSIIIKYEAFDENIRNIFIEKGRVWQIKR